MWGRKKGKIVKISDDERKAIERELFIRVKELIYINGRNKVSEMVDQIISSQKCFDNNDSSKLINLNYDFTMCWGDFLQIISRERMKSEKKA